ncbi:hypothetical protein SAMN05192558_10578 [Actinokineospora alba]|uniref:Uncharacterized protein n=1 Tax=Actinokineospora alba TaxID=504798 RepID=A0A1H0MWC1_9PSEU|nr:hypothetical protein [Actinokineospora alba]TDP68451.1 hypothetical protein C8E96_4016 [Actinokineospora alba]SDH79344.1 hypothetical protein SAMN05421871_102128 [Actinokineospora alba]SDO84420.1 hypothetical protein SAMN05192558_10578 [Actinokineospora alba]
MTTNTRVRWGLAVILFLAAIVDAYLAMSESVVWPAILAVLWIGIAGALISARPASPVVDAPSPHPVPVPARAAHV